MTVNLLDRFEQFNDRYFFTSLINITDVSQTGLMGQNRRTNKSKISLEKFPEHSADSTGKRAKSQEVTFHQCLNYVR